MNNLNICLVLFLGRQTSCKKFIVQQKDEVFKDIDLTLSGIPTQRDVSLLRLACCGQDTGLSARYVKETAEAFVWVDVRELQPVDSITGEYFDDACAYEVTVATLKFNFVLMRIFASTLLGLGKLVHLSGELMSCVGYSE